MKNPDKTGIEQFVEKKRQRNTLVAILCVLAGLILLIVNIYLHKPELGSILNTINPLFWLAMGIIFFRKGKTIQLEEGELDALLQKAQNESEMSA